MQSSIAWKSGPIEAPFPFTHQCSTYDSLCNSNTLAEYIRQHTECAYLLDQLLSTESMTAIVDSFTHESTESEEQSKQMQQDTELLDKCLAAGINVHPIEVMRVLEKQIHTFSKWNPSLMFKYSQLRLWAMNSLSNTCLSEWEKKIKSEPKRNWAVNRLNSAENPELLVLLPAISLGVSMLSSIKAIIDSRPSENISSITLPVITFCRSLQKLEGLQLQESCLPKQQMFTKVHRSSYTVSVHKNGKISTHMPSSSSSSSVGVLDDFEIVVITFASPQDISGFQLSWINDDNDESFIGAPEQYTISYKVHESANHVVLGKYNTTAVKLRSRSWRMNHVVDSDRVTELKITTSKQLNAYNVLDKCVLYGLDIFSKSESPLQVRLLDTLQIVNENLYAFLSNELIRSDAFGAIMATISSTASLPLILGLIFSSLHVGSSTYSSLSLVERSILERALSNMNATGQSALLTVENSLSTKFLKVPLNASHIVASSRFETALTTPQLCIQSATDHVVTTDKGFDFCVIIPNVESDDFEEEVWDLTVEDRSGLWLGFLKMTAVDGKLRVLTNDSDFDQIDVSSCWLWCVENGDVMLHDTIDKCWKGVQVFAAGDTLRITRKVVTGVVSCEINSGKSVILFQDVEKKSVPIIAVQKDSVIANKIVSNLEITYRKNGSGTHDIQQLPTFDSAKLPDSISMTNATVLILELIAKICKVLHIATDCEGYLLQERYFPYALDLKISTFAMFGKLLTSLMSLDTNFLVTNLVIEILNLQLFRVCKWESPRLELVVLFEQESGCNRETAEQFVDSTLRCIRNCFEHFKNIGGNTTTIDLCNRCLVTGMPVLFPTAADRCSLLLSYLEHDNHSNEGSAGRSNLISWFEHNSRPEEIEILISTDSHVDRTLSVGDIICKILNLVQQSELTSWGFGHSCSWDMTLRCAAASFLSKYFRHLLLYRDSIHTDRSLLRTGVESLLNSALGELMVIKEHSMNKDAANLFARSQIFETILLPIIHEFAAQHQSLKFVSDNIAGVRKLGLELLSLSSSSQTWQDAATVLSMLAGDNNESLGTTSSSQWRPVNATLLPGDSTFVIDSSGVVYTSVTSANTCAYASVGFSKDQKAAWEFVLDSDSLDDECSVFGAVRLPLTSRCYSSSTSLWMRRSYNGGLYELGQMTSLAMKKIHPGSTVRVEFDGPAGTLSFSVDGDEMQVAFSGIAETVYPACGSYRNGVSIRLAKVEVFSSLQQHSNISSGSEFLPLADIRWSLASQVFRNKPHDILWDCDLTNSWISDVGTRGAAWGIHEWMVSFVGNPSYFAVGLIVGTTSGICRNGTFFSLGHGISSESPRSLAWTYDGSLWYNGIRVSHGYGGDVLPLPSDSTIRLRVDRRAQTLEVFVNNKSLGIAFGPESTGKYSLPSIDSSFTKQGSLIFPAVAIKSTSLKVKIASCGISGSTIVPACLSAAVCVSSVFCNMVARLLTTSSTIEEDIVSEALESSMFMGGIDEEYIDLSPSSSAKFCALSLKNISVHDEISPYLINSTHVSSVNPYLGNLLITDISSLEPWVLQFMDWLDSHDPEPEGFKKILEKTNTYKFLQCELPMLAALIKHSNLIDELESFALGVTSAHPSEGLSFVWQKIKQLRSYLRKQRQRLRESLDIDKAFEIELLSQTESFGLADRVVWYHVSVVDQIGQAVVAAVGKDKTSSNIYVYVKDLATLASSFALIIGDTTNFSAEFRNMGSDVLIWFDMSGLKSTVDLSTGFDVQIQSSDSDLSAGTCRVALGRPMNMDAPSKSSFDTLCDTIVMRARLLVCFTSGVHLDQQSRLELIELSSIYSSVSKPSKPDLSRRKTEERWKRVVEFLHVQSRLSKQLSDSRDVPDSDIVANHSLGQTSEISFAQAASQACASFIMSEIPGTDISLICDALSTRLERALCRIHGFINVKAFLESDSFRHNPIWATDFLNFMRPFVLGKTKSNCLRSHKRITRTFNHYMSNLEGCPSKVLMGLRTAVKFIFGELSTMATHAVEKWECKEFRVQRMSYWAYSQAPFQHFHWYNNVAAILKWWTMRFSSVDAHWILNCGIFDCLKRITSQLQVGSLQTQLMKSCQSVFEVVVSEIAGDRSENIPTILAGDSTYLFDSLLSGSLSPITLYLQIVCSSIGCEADLPVGPLLSQFGLSQELQNVSIEMASEHFARYQATRANPGWNSALLALQHKKLYARCQSRGCFDVNKKAASIELSNDFTEATLQQSCTNESICVFASFPQSATGEICKEMYFEITILELGDGDIGIGLADKDSFECSGNMPGWIDKSFGYHGDDGKKYGINSTPGDWPKFHAGDVVGCGVDAQRKVIYFTLNGQLLGDGFKDVPDRIFSPVVGFSDRHRSCNRVRINFGRVKFSYSGAPTLGELHSEPTAGKDGGENIETLESILSAFQLQSQISAKLCHSAKLCDLSCKVAKYVIIQPLLECASEESHELDIKYCRAFARLGCKQPVEIFRDSADPLANAIAENIASGIRSFRSLSIGQDWTIGSSILSTSALLSTVNHCVMSFQSAKDYFSQKALDCLLSFLDKGTCGHQLTVVSLLKRLLPRLAPEDVDRQTPEAWRAEICCLDTIIEHVQRRVLQPDIIIKKLLLMASRCYGAQGSFAFGSSHSSILLKQAVVQLLQSLLRSSQWSDIVARTMNMILRGVYHALQCDDAINPMIFSIGSAVVECLSFKPHLFEGTRVVLDSKAEGLIVDMNSKDNEVGVALKSTHPLSQLALIEYVKRDSLHTKASTLDIDSLSQPLMPAYFDLVHWSLKWVKDNTDPVVVNPHPTAFSRLMFTSLYQLLEIHGSSISEALMGIDMCAEMMDVSLQPIPFAHVSSSNRLQSLEFVAQRIFLETALVTENPNASERPDCVTKSDSCSSLSLGSTLDTQILEISVESRAGTKDTIQSFAQSNNLDFDSAAQLLEYTNFDVVKASSLATDYECNIDNPQDSEAKLTKADSVVPAPQYDDSNVMRFAMSFSEDMDLMDSNIQWQHFVNVQHSSAKVIEDNTLVTTGKAEGKYLWDSICFERVKQYLGSGYLLIGRNDKLENNFVRYVEQSDVATVQSALQKAPISIELATIQLSLITLSARNIVESLLASGVMDVSAVPQRDLMKYVKLRAISSSYRVPEALERILRGSPKNDVSSGYWSRTILKGLAAEIPLDLRSVCTFGAANLSMSSQEPLTVRSIHPLQSPHHAEGRIIGFKDGKGMKVDFDKRSQFPDCRTALHFYISQDNFQMNKPDFSFAGNSFRSFFVNGIHELFYRFDIPTDANYPLIALKSAVGKFSFVDQILMRLHSNSSDRVGLGEDDTLFNLFDMEMKVHDNKISTVFVDRDIMEGNWVFQVEIIGCPSGDADSSSSLLSIGIQSLASLQNFVDDSYIGCDEKGVFVNSNGKIGSPTMQAEAMGHFVVGDIWSFLICKDANTMTLSTTRNGQSWSSPVSLVGVSDGRVAISLSSDWIVKLNFGEQPLAVTASPVCCSPLFKSISPIQLRSQSWGYKFTITPIAELPICVTREFELIWQSSINDSEKRSDASSRSFWIWRPKSNGHFLPVADVITTTPSPPKRAVLVYQGICKRPIDYKCVFNCSKQNITVWRAICEDGYVAMGDVVSKSSGSAFPPSQYTTSVCIPKWAVKECDSSEMVISFRDGEDSKKAKSLTMTLWTSDCGLGYFFGSAESISPGEPADSPMQRVGQGYEFCSTSLSELNAVWTKESDVQRYPDFTWSLSLLQFLLSSLPYRHLGLTSEIFSALVEYLRCNLSVNPLKVLPILNTMIRLASIHSIPLPLHETKSICKAILLDAVECSQTQSAVPPSLMALVDFVVEIQAVHVVESSLKDRQAISRNMERGKMRFDYWDAQKSSCKLEADDMDNPAHSSEGKPFSATNHGKFEALLERLERDSWWDRSRLHSQDLKLHRVIKKDNLDNLFCKESLLLKLKQVLKFILAVHGAPESKKALEKPLSLERSFPKLMTSKLWYDLVCGCSFFESQHPYKSNDYYRTVRFPGASKLRVTLDQRYALSKGDKLRLLYHGGEIVLEHELAADNNVLTIIGDSLVIALEPAYAHSSLVNPTNEWGWAVVVSAHGPFLEESSIVLEDLQQEYRKAIKAQGSMGSTASCSSFIAEAEALPVDSMCAGELMSTSTSASLALARNNDEIRSSSPSECDESEPERFSAKWESPVPELAGPRPGSQRGRRETPPVTVSIEPAQKAGMTLAKDSPSSEDLIAAQGTIIRSCEVVIPYASQLEIELTRVSDSSDEALVTMVRLTHVEKDKAEIMQKQTLFRVEPNSSQKVVIPESKVFLEVIVVEIESVPVTDEVADSTRLVAFDLPTSESTESVEKGPTSLVDCTSLEVGLGELSLVESTTASPSNTWQCPVCTLINDEVECMCAVCGSLRPGDSSQPLEGDADHQPLWYCPACTLLNPLNLNQCSACGHERSESNASPTPSGVSETPAGSQTTEHTPVTVINESPKKKTAAALKIVVRGTLDSPARFETRLESAILSGGSILTPLQVHHRVSSWTRECDEALLSFLNSRSATTKVPLLSEFSLSNKFLMYEGSILSNMTMIDIIIRTHLFDSFNRQVSSLLPLINLSSDDPYSFAFMIRQCNCYILEQTKMPLLEKAIAGSAPKESEKAALPASIVLDNMKAMQSRDDNNVDISSSNNCFAQAFRQLRKQSAVVFRHCFSTDRVFQITFAEESGVDAGGVFREGLSRILEDLFSPQFNLLAITPNGQQGVHTDMDKYLPNPKHCGPLALEMLTFVGRLIAMSIRVKLCLPFQFAGLVWKKIIRETVVARDLHEIDKIVAKQLDDLETCHLDSNQPVTDQDSFVERFGDRLTFTCCGIDGVVRDLCKYGSTRSVTFENRQEYVDLVRTVRLKEFDLQAAAIAKGMFEVIPSNALLLFSATQLEILACGSPVIDLELWKAQTEVQVSPELAQLFWKVMESLSASEQAGFIRFAWGRSRLPRRKEDFTMKMKLQNGGRLALPVSHTCFFSIELPDYTTEEQMRHGLLTAIHFGMGGILNS